MIKVCLVVSDYLKNNRIFDESGIHRDDIFDRFCVLKKKFKSLGFDLQTQDINTINESDIVLYASNMPQDLPERNKVDKSYIILSESEFIRPDNYDLEKHKYFKRIFTWKDDIVDGEKYIKLNYAHKIPNSININNNKDKLLVLISANKKPPFSKNKDLYSERVSAIRWFEKNAANDFDLYGIGWDRFRFYGPRLIRVLNRAPFIGKLIYKIFKLGYPSYKGMVDNKKEVMEKYKFSICYENAKDIPGYITEKIFDSFFAGCVPVYFGADNIDKHIPKECFIDMRSFDNYEDLYHFLKNMPNERYEEYLNAIFNYIQSRSIYPFSSEGFSDTIIEIIKKDYNKNDNF